MDAQKVGLLLVALGAALVSAASCNGAGAVGNTGGASGTGGATTTTGPTGSQVSSTSGVSTGVGGSGGTGGGSTSSLGAACMSDTDCGGGGLTCITASTDSPVFGGGPANGYCASMCTTDADCTEQASVCVTGAANMPGLCLLECTLGPQLMFLNDALNPDKCQGRNDLRCGPVGSEGTVKACLPTCGEDTQCPSGRVCDPSLKVCVTAATMGAAEGTACDPMASSPTCAGVCVSFTGGNETMCSEYCVLGGDPNNPADTPNCGGPTSGYCLFSPQGNGAGDYGFCSPACTSQDGCQTPAFWCMPVGGLTGKGVQNGYCLGATACPNGNSDCAMAMGTTCTQTTDGPFCLTSDFPLGSTGLDGGTDGGDAGGTDGGDDAGTDGGANDAGGSDAGGGGAGPGDAGAADAGDAGDGG
jgi:hypothetical protein